MYLWCLDIADEMELLQILQDYEQQMLDQQRLEQLQHLYSKALSLIAGVVAGL
jgi:hypothetical protein